MRIIFLLIFIFLSNCNNPKTVLICGDHVCINKTEAKQYFEENLSIEVKIIDRKIEEEVDLVELNLRKDESGKKKINIYAKKKTSNDLKSLSNKEIVEIKKKIRTKEKERKVAKKNIDKNQKIKNKSQQKTKEMISNNKTDQINVNKKKKELVDVCTILEECSIDKISKYLLNQGKNKSFPDITTRQ